MTNEQKRAATELVFEMLERALADSDITLAIQMGKIWFDSDRGVIVLEVVDG